MEDKIYQYLIEHHIGKDNLIKNQYLRKMFDIKSDKSLRKIIQNIRESKEYYLIIGSVSGKTGGYYICQTQDEIADTIDNIRHRANEMLRMCHVLDWKKGKVTQ